MQFWVWICGVAVAGPSRAEHHGAAFDSALVHFAEVDCGEVDFKRAFVAECFKTDGALDSTFSCDWVDQCGW